MEAHHFTNLARKKWYIQTAFLLPAILFGALTTFGIIPHLSDSSPWGTFVVITAMFVMAVSSASACGRMAEHEEKQVKALQEIVEIKMHKWLTTTYKISEVDVLNERFEDWVDNMLDEDSPAPIKVTLDTGEVYTYNIRLDGDNIVLDQNTSGTPSPESLLRERMS